MGAKTEKVRVNGLLREKQAKKLWMEEHRKREERKLQDAAAMEAECERARSKSAGFTKASTDGPEASTASNPNSRFALHQRQGRNGMQVCYGDGRPGMLSR